MKENEELQYQITSERIKNELAPHIAKKLLRLEGLKVANWILIRKGEPLPDFEKVKSHLGPVVFVKPANMGSSVGVSRVTDIEGFEQAVRDAFSFDRKVLIEEEISGRELECAVKGNQLPEASGIGEVKAADFYTYDEKYSDESTTDLDIPANITSDEVQKLRETAIKAYQALECSGLSRVDMFLTNNGEVCVNEINTMPGFTSISMYPSLWQQEGLSYTELVDELIGFAIEKSAS